MPELKRPKDRGERDAKKRMRGRVTGTIRESFECGSARATETISNDPRYLEGADLERRVENWGNRDIWQD